MFTADAALTLFPNRSSRKIAGGFHGWHYRGHWWTHTAWIAGSEFGVFTGGSSTGAVRNRLAI